MKKEADEIKVSEEATIIMTKAIERIIQDMTRSAYKYAIDNRVSKNRRKKFGDKFNLNKQDILSVIQGSPMYHFLIDTFPRNELQLD